MESFKVLPKVKAVFRLSMEPEPFDLKIDLFDLKTKAADYYNRHIQEGERLMMFLPSFVFTAFIQELDREVFVPNTNRHSMNDGLIGAFRFPTVAFIWTDAFLLPQEAFLSSAFFSKLSKPDFLHFAQI